MDKQDLGEQIIALMPTLFHVSCGLLHCEADREDAVQAAIEKAWRKAASLRDAARLKPWLVRILINECYAILRKKKREIPVEALPETGGSAQLGDSALKDAVMRLPENVRLPIVLHYMDGFSIKEIASALRCPQGTVLSRMDRGRRQLRDLLMEVEER